jgi:hypothetical protein
MWPVIDVSAEQRASQARGRAAVDQKTCGSSPSSKWCSFRIKQKRGRARSGELHMVCMGREDSVEKLRRLQLAEALSRKARL